LKTELINMIDPSVIATSSTLKTFGQIVAKSMKSTTDECCSRSTMLPATLMVSAIV